MIRLLPIAVAVCLAAAPALAMENLYRFETLGQSPDYRAHPRSFAVYRQIVMDLFDPTGICRDAGHLDQCLWRIEGQKYPLPPEFVAFVRWLEDGHVMILYGPEREPRPNDNPLRWPVAK
jgi:hypothetical protein